MVYGLTFFFFFVFFFAICGEVRVDLEFAKEAIMASS